MNLKYSKKTSCFSATCDSYDTYENYPYKETCIKKAFWLQLQALVLNTPLMTPLLAPFSQNTFHLCHSLIFRYVISLSGFHWFLNKHGRKWIKKNAEIFTMYYNMKFILLCSQIKLNNEICNTTQNYTTKCASCCTIKFIKKFIFVCVLVLLNRGK